MPLVKIEVRPWLAVLVIAAAGFGVPAFAARADEPPPTTTTAPVPDTPAVTTSPSPTPAPDKAPVTTTKAKPKPKTTTSARTTPRTFAPVQQPVRPVVTSPPTTHVATTQKQNAAKAKAKARAAAKAKAKAKARAKARAQAVARAKAKQAAEAAARLQLPRPREPFTGTRSSAAVPPGSTAGTGSGVRVAALVIASLAVGLIALAALSAPVLELVGARHPRAATTLCDRRPEIAVAGVSLFIALTILAALSRWVI